MQRESHRPSFLAPLAPARARVADPTIRQPVEPAPEPAPVPANHPAGGIPRQPFAARPARPQGDVRVLPLAAFHWGEPGRARVRGDHCLIRIVAGTVRLALPVGGMTHGAGTVVFVPAGTAFAVAPQPGVSGQVLLVPRAVAAGLALPLPGRMVVGTDEAGGVSAQLRELARQADDPIAAATAISRVGIISASLNRLAADGAATRPREAAAGDRALVTDYLDLAGREMGRGRTTADLAQALGTSASALDAACLRQRGQSALQLMYALRLDRARALIAAGAPLGAVAERLGFTGVPHLNRAFMAATGRPAHAFRRTPA